MRKTAFVLPVIVATAMGSLVIAGPASAAVTPVTVQVVGGALSVTAPTATVDLGTVTASATVQTTDPVSLGNVTVTDERGGTDGWTATAVSTALTNTDTTATIPVSAISYTTGNASVTPDTATVTGTNPTSLATAATVQATTLVSGPHIATWSPTITVTVPASTLAGTYSGTITHSVS